MMDSVQCTKLVWLLIIDLLTPNDAITIMLGHAAFSISMEWPSLNDAENCSDLYVQLGLTTHTFQINCFLSSD